MRSCLISVVTPTFRRPEEVRSLLRSVSLQSVLPSELILVDGADGETETEELVAEVRNDYPFEINYIRQNGGTAIQRNTGIDVAKGKFVALVDDDVRLEKDFLKNIIAVFDLDAENVVGGVVGYRTNRHFRLDRSARWRWYKRLGLLTVFEPGRYDFKCGYPINNNLQPPFSDTRRVDFMTTACAVWRREVFDSGLRFDPFFRDYGVLEDAHFSLRAGRRWTLLQAGSAKCEELHSPNGRVDRRKIGYKCVVNYYFVFRDIVGPLSAAHKLRFWRFQAFEFLRILASALFRRNWNDAMDLRGRLDAYLQIFRSKAF